MTNIINDTRETILYALKKLENELLEAISDKEMYKEMHKMCSTNLEICRYQNAELETRVQAMERALNGCCWACSHANAAIHDLPSRITVAPNEPKRFSLMTCEHYKGRHIGNVRDCKHWQFDYARFAEDAKL